MLRPRTDAQRHIDSLETLRTIILDYFKGEGCGIARGRDKTDGLNVKIASQYEFTFTAGYTNGRVGYALTRDDYNGGAYEVSLSRLALEWQEIFEKRQWRFSGNFSYNYFVSNLLLIDSLTQVY